MLRVRLSVIDYIAFHLTYVCENKCPYCYVGDEGRETHPPFERVKKIVRKLARDGIKEILLVGGNPCTYPRLKEVVGLMKKLNLKVYIISNTLSFKEKDFFLENIDDFQATILGSRAKEHDAEAGREGAYSILLNNIKFLNARGRKVTIALSLHKQNFDRVFEIVRNLVENEGIKIKELVIQRIIPCGRAANTLEFSIARKEEVDEIFKQLHQLRKKYGLRIDFEDPFPLCIVDESYRYLQTHACEWGFRKGSVDFKGNIGRCGADCRFLLGNIFDIPDLQRFWRENPILVDFRSREWLHSKCRNCDLLERCGGGCSLSRITQKDHDCDLLCPLCRC
jgi:radical SAM protein with 4Fe4S-binding SPASM domain